MIKRTLELDHRISQRLQLVENPGILRNLAVFFAHSGDSWFWLLGLGVMWFFGNAYWKQRALIAIICILILALFVLAIKFSVRRQRPAGEWGVIYRKSDPHSFPSGHAARAVMLAVLAVGLGPIAAGIILVFWAPLVILARVFMGVHYLSDVLAGALLGIFAGLLGLMLISLLKVPF